MNTWRKLVKLEADLKALKQAVTKKPDLTTDAKAWRKIERTARAARKRTFQKYYG